MHNFSVNAKKKKKKRKSVVWVSNIDGYGLLESVFKKKIIVLSSFQCFSHEKLEFLHVYFLWIQDEREMKRQRRKQSNRESARRSRLRKQVIRPQLNF